MSSIISPDYNKKLIFRTDANNICIGAVLIQVVDGKEKPIQ